MTQKIPSMTKKKVTISKTNNNNHCYTLSNILSKLKKKNGGANIQHFSSSSDDSSSLPQYNFFVVNACLQLQSFLAQFMSTLLGEHFATDENGSFLSWLESATRTASMAQTPITRKLRFRLRISHERSYGQSVLMKESTAFLILSWLSTPQSESGLESVTTYKNLGVYTNSIRLSWSSAFFNDGRDQHLTYSLAKFLPMVLHPLSYWSLQYNSIDILLPPPMFFFGLCCSLAGTQTSI